jgi:hypothetical protein
MNQTFARRACLLAVVALALLCAGVLSSPALAAGAPSPTATTPATTTTPTTTTTTPVPTPKPKPKPKPARATAALYLANLFFVHGDAVTVPKRSFEVSGVVRPYVPGQWITLRAYLNGRQFTWFRLRLKPSARRVYGGFTERLAAPGAGQVTVKVQHSATAVQTGFRIARGVASLDENVGFGATGRFVQLIQQRLAALHFFIPQTGVYDQHTGLAVDAYHRLLGWGTSQLLGPATVNAILNGVGAFQVRFPDQGRHAEGNLGKQLLALIDGDQVFWIFPISSGKPSTPTILGNFRVYSRVPGYLPDGMYFSDFFIRGYAIHGYSPAPDYPASHGCMRLPIIDAIPAFNWLAIGDGVDTYY